MLRMSADAFLFAPFDFEPEAVGAFRSYLYGFCHQPSSLLLCGKLEAIASNLLGSFILLLMGYASSFPPPSDLAQRAFRGWGHAPILRAHGDKMGILDHHSLSDLAICFQHDRQIGNRRPL